MDSEKSGGNNNQPNEAYDAWNNMADEVMNQDKNDWASFECKIKSPEDIAAFRENMGRLDDRTQNYLKELPGNIDKIFGVGEKGTEMSYKVQSEIIDNTIAGRYISSMQDEDGDFENEYNLYLADNGDLYDTKIDAEEDNGNIRENLKALNEHKINEWATEMITSIHGVNYEMLKRFDLNMSKLDEKTQNYLLNLPNNIRKIFKKDGNLYATSNEEQEVQLEIERKVIEGVFTREHPTKGKEFYLHLTEAGELYTHEDRR